MNDIYIIYVLSPYREYEELLRNYLWQVRVLNVHLQRKIAGIAGYVKIFRCCRCVFKQVIVISNVLTVPYIRIERKSLIYFKQFR